MHINIKAKEFDPTRVVTMNGARELSFSSIPVTSSLERDVGGGVMDNGESTCSKKKCKKNRLIWVNSREKKWKKNVIFFFKKNQNLKGKQQKLTHPEVIS